MRGVWNEPCTLERNVLRKGAAAWISALLFRPQGFLSTLSHLIECVARKRNVSLPKEAKNRKPCRKEVFGRPMVFPPVLLCLDDVQMLASNETPFAAYHCRWESLKTPFMSQTAMKGGSSD